MFRMEIFSLARLAKGKRIDPARRNAGLPDLDEKLIDIYISPRSMDWTKVFTNAFVAPKRARPNSTPPQKVRRSCSP